MAEPTKYVIDPLSPFPKRWEDHRGPLRVMCEPAEGYVMIRRRGAMPFCLPVATLLNAERDPFHGPFRLIEKRRPTSKDG